jgi:hypothetical protein
MPLQARFLSEINAAVELKMPWPISRAFEARMAECVKGAKDSAWWESQERVAITRA